MIALFSTMLSTFKNRYGYATGLKFCDKLHTGKSIIIKVHVYWDTSFQEFNGTRYMYNKGQYMIQDLIQMLSIIWETLSYIFPKQKFNHILATFKSFQTPNSSFKIIIILCNPS